MEGIARNRGGVLARFQRFETACLVAVVDLQQQQREPERRLKEQHQILAPIVEDCRERPDHVAIRTRREIVGDGIDGWIASGLAGPVHIDDVVDPAR